MSEVLLDGWRQHEIMAEIQQTQYMAQDAIIFNMLNPRLIEEGNQWCCIYGNMPVGYIAGFGDTPKQAVEAFINEYKTRTLTKKHP